jgi:hypothetical protein
MKTIKDMIFLAFQSSAEPIPIDKLDKLLASLGALLEKVDKKASFSRLKRPSSSSSSSSKKISMQKGGMKRGLMKKGGSIIHYYHHLHQKRKSSKKHTLTTSSSKKVSTYNTE